MVFSHLTILAMKRLEWTKLCWSPCSFASTGV